MRPEPALNRFLSSLWLTLKSLIATILLPGVITGYLPWRYFGLSTVSLEELRPWQYTAPPILFVGIGILLTCIWEFARSGRGTLAPVDPPKHLVTQGLYRYVRNPMYLGVGLILLGELILAGTATFAEYAAGFCVLVNLFVLGYEEPMLTHLFGDEYLAYRARVPRWLPRL